MRIWCSLKNTDFRKRFFGTLLLESCFQNHPDSVTLQKYKSLSNQSLKHNSAHLTYLNLTPTLSFEPRFSIFIINSYCNKRKACSPWIPCLYQILSWELVFYRSFYMFASIVLAREEKLDVRVK